MLITKAVLSKTYTTTTLGFQIYEEYDWLHAFLLDYKKLYFKTRKKSTSCKRLHDSCITFVIPRSRLQNFWFCLQKQDLSLKHQSPSPGLVYLHLYAQCIRRIFFLEGDARIRLYKQRSRTSLFVWTSFERIWKRCANALFGNLSLWFSLIDIVEVL